MLGRHKTNEVRPSKAVNLQGVGAVLLNVRQAEEWSAGRAPDVVHAPPTRAGEVGERHVCRQVMTVCRSGARSRGAAKTLAAAGVDVRTVAGGMSAWTTAGPPEVREGGSPGRVA
jgi:rhodanese-related sulfurtransferase